VKLGITAPNLEDVLPYKYAYNTAHGTPLYRSVPSKEEMLKYEPYLEAAKRAKKKAERAKEKEEAEASGGGSSSAPAEDAKQAEPTPENFVAAIQRLYPNDADKVLRVYNPKTPDEVLDAAMALASARFIALGRGSLRKCTRRPAGSLRTATSTRVSVRSSWGRPASRLRKMPRLRGEQRTRPRSSTQWAISIWTHGIRGIRTTARSLRQCRATS